MDNRYTFDFEKLEVYKKGLNFARRIFKLTDSLPRNRNFHIVHLRKVPCSSGLYFPNTARNYQYSLGDQLRRAALSIVNNIAEGSGKIYRKEKAQFYRISINSARECIPMLTILEEEKLQCGCDLNGLRKECIHICNMLGKLVSVIK